MTAAPLPTIAGVGMTRQGRLESGPAALAREAVVAALADAGMDGHRLGMVFVGNALGGALCGQESIRGQSWLVDAGLGTVPVVNVENACAGGAAALHLACLAVNAGEAPVLAVGVEKMWTGDRAATLRGIEGSLPEAERAGLRVRLSDAQGSLFMALNAAWAQRQVQQRDTTVEHFAAAAVKARRHAAANPRAQARARVTVDEVLASPVVASPLTRLMCSSFTDGAAAVVVTRGSGPRVLASILSSGDGTLEYHDRIGHAAQMGWKAAGVGPGDLDVVEVHDATSAEELYALESLGFFEVGEAGPATVDGRTTYGGDVVVNPSGGLVARGHPLGATGLCQVVEVVEQLRGSAGARQVENARLGAAINTGGILGAAGDTASVGVHVVGA